MGKQDPATMRLSHGEQRALVAFLGGRLPAGQLHAALCRERQAALEAAAAAPAAPSPAPTPVLRVA